VPQREESQLSTPFLFPDSCVNCHPPSVSVLISLFTRQRQRHTSPFQPIPSIAPIISIWFVSPLNCSVSHKDENLYALAGGQRSKMHWVNYQSPDFIFPIRAGKVAPLISGNKNSSFVSPLHFTKNICISKCLASLLANRPRLTRSSSNFNSNNAKKYTTQTFIKFYGQQIECHFMARKAPFVVLLAMSVFYFSYFCSISKQ